MQTRRNLLKLVGSSLCAVPFLGSKLLGKSTDQSVDVTDKKSGWAYPKVDYYSPVTINNIGGYAAGHRLPIQVNDENSDRGFGGVTKLPRMGQILAIGNGISRCVYTIIKHVEIVSASKINILLDRPLESAVADNDKVFLGATINYDFTFRRIWREENVELPYEGTTDEIDDNS